MPAGSVNPAASLRSRQVPGYTGSSSLSASFGALAASARSLREQMHGYRNPPAAAAAKPPDSAPGAHSASKGRTLRHSPGPQSNEFPASANLQSWRERIPGASVADPDPHSAASKFPDFRSPVAQRSRRSAHGQYAAARSARAPGVRDNSARTSRGRTRRGMKRGVVHKGLLTKTF